MTAMNPSDTTTIVTRGWRVKATLKNRGQQYSSYEAPRICASVVGTLIPNSCGGAYWQAYRHSPQL